MELLRSKNENRYRLVGHVGGINVASECPGAAIGVVRYAYREGIDAV
jgi:hypothetical protein